MSLTCSAGLPLALRSSRSRPLQANDRANRPSIHARDASLTPLRLKPPPLRGLDLYIFNRCYIINNSLLVIINYYNYLCVLIFCV